ncbi:hypothetical protein HC762_01270, partial [bacterium]|nr:hypothetical protein [bacterium]
QRPEAPGGVAVEDYAGTFVNVRGGKRVTIDMDPTDTPTYGAQQLTFFNAHYDNYCYLPLLGFLTFNDEAEQYASGHEGALTSRAHCAQLPLSCHAAAPAASRQPYSRITTPR